MQTLLTTKQYSLVPRLEKFINFDTMRLLNNQHFELQRNLNQWSLMMKKIRRTERNEDLSHF